MPFIRSDSSNGTTSSDFIFGDTGGTSTLSGGDNNDLIVGDFGPVVLSSSLAAHDTPTTAASIDAAANWSSQGNPLLQGAPRPSTSLHITGAGEAEFFSVSVGANETLTIDTDFGTFDTIVQVGHMVSGNFVLLDENDYSSALDPAGRPNQTDSYLEYVNTSGSTQLVIRVSQFNCSNVN